MRISIDAQWAFDRYCQIADRLPVAEFLKSSEPHDTLAPLTDRFDAFVFDSFGVLNVGETPIESAPHRIQALREAGKRVFVLTNAASLPIKANQKKYEDLGFDFVDQEIVSSRAVLSKHLEAMALPPSFTWAVAAPPNADLGELPCRAVPFDVGSCNNCDGIILLSSANWGDAEQLTLSKLMTRNPRPFLVGNPDLVAPRETGFSREPGFFAHEIADETGIKPMFFGKPFGNAFDAVLERLEGNVTRSRILMIGDTLHTDILGGRAAGFGTALVTAHGVMRDLDVTECIQRSGIVPDFVLPRI